MAQYKPKMLQSVNFKREKNGTAERYLCVFFNIIKYIILNYVNILQIICVNIQYIVVLRHNF